MPLPAALAAAGIEISVDSEPIVRQFALLADDGTITPLFSDGASRALFLDERLRDRPAELRVKRFPGVPYAQVITFRVEEAGRLRTPEYFCNLCRISVRSPQICPCCQGELELRYRPVEETTRNSSQ